MDVPRRLSPRQILGGFCIGFGAAAYLFGVLAYIWLQHMFIMGVSNWGIGSLFLASPAVVMLIGVAAIWKASSHER